MKTTITIGSIFEGMTPSQNFGADNEYLMGIGIDPDVPTTDDPSDIKTGGFIRPVHYSAFSGAEITSPPIAIITTPAYTSVYVVLSDGTLLVYDHNLENPYVKGYVQESGQRVGARGAFYYNNYIYIITPHDVSRYGALEDSEAGITDEIWTGSLLGNQDALIDSQYPETVFSIGYLNHFGFVHNDGCAYFLDYKDHLGYIHKIQTTMDTYQGDIDDGSAYGSVGALSTPFDYAPITASSYGTDIVISAAMTDDKNINQGNAILCFWNAADELFYRIVKLPDPICSVLKYVNGVLYGISGDLKGGYRLFRYVGGDSIETLKIIEDGYPPLQNASDFAGNRIVWATNTAIPYITSGIMAYGSKSDMFPKGLHYIALIDFQ